MSATQSESQRDSGLQPRVARHALPWVNRSNPPQPQRGCACHRAPIRRNPGGVGGFVDSISQGSAPRNPGLSDVAPLGQPEPTPRPAAVAELDSDTLVAEVKRIRGKKLPLTAAGVQGLRQEYTGTIEPSRALAAETLKLEGALSDLVNQAYGLTPAEIALMWQTAPPRMPIPPPKS